MRTPKSANGPRSNSFRPDSPSTTNFPRGRKTQPSPSPHRTWSVPDASSTPQLNLHLTTSEIISRKLGEWLDKEDFIDDSYILEVSSPGLGRPLKKEKDFVRSMGKDVEVRLYKPLNKQKEYTGALKSYDADTVTITLEDGNDLIFAKADIALIRLAL